MYGFALMHIKERALCSLWTLETSDFRYNHCLLYSSLHLSEASKKTTDKIWFFSKTKHTMKKE